MEKPQKMNKMGTEKISRLLLTMGVPMIISMVVQAVYNIVDSYFVSCMKDPNIPALGDYAVNALTLAFPVQMLLHWQAEKSLDDMCRDSWRWQSNNPNGYRDA